MNVNSYVKDKMEREKQLGLLVDKVANNIKTNARDQVFLIDNGFHRLLNRGSCFFDDYKDICKQLNKEDWRMLLAIKKLYDNFDIIVVMLELYIKSLLKTEEQRERTYKKLIGLIAKSTSTRSTNLVLSYAIAQVIAKSTSISEAATIALYKYGKSGFFLFSSYGRVQVAANEAQKLEITNPKYYNTLYNLDLEMLYFVIDPAIQKAIVYAKKRANEEFEIPYYIIEGLLNNG